MLGTQEQWGGADVPLVGQGEDSALPQALVERLPPLAGYLHACFPSLAQLTLAIVRHQGALRLRARYSLRGEAIERLLWFGIAEPCAPRDLLGACAELQRALHAGTRQPLF